MHVPCLSPCRHLNRSLHGSLACCCCCRRCCCCFDWGTTNTLDCKPRDASRANTKGGGAPVSHAPSQRAHHSLPNPLPPDCRCCCCLPRLPCRISCSKATLSTEEGAPLLMGPPADRGLMATPAAHSGGSGVGRVGWRRGVAATAARPVCAAGDVDAGSGNHLHAASQTAALVRPTCCMRVGCFLCGVPLGKVPPSVVLHSLHQGRVWGGGGVEAQGGCLMNGWEHTGGERRRGKTRGDGRGSTRVALHCRNRGTAACVCCDGREAGQAQDADGARSRWMARALASVPT